MLYRFHGFELDERLYQLRRGGKLIDIEPKAFDVLAYLLHSRDRVVSKDELLEKLWPDQVVNETALTRAIATARKAVRDDGVKQEVIETQHGRGYRFVAAVAEGAEESAIQPEGTPRRDDSAEQLSVSTKTPEVISAYSYRSWLLGRLMLVGLLLIVGVAAVVQYLSLRPPTPSANIPPEQSQPLPLPDKPSIAVLPFKNLSGDPAQEYFCDAMWDDLITDLSKLSGLLVIAWHSAVTYKGRTVKVQDVSRELGVRYVVEGGVRKDGDQIRITVRLVDAATGGLVWAERYDRPWQDVFAVQEEVRRKIVVHLGLKLTTEEQARLKRTYTPSPEAYDSVERGYEQLFRFTPAGTAQARRLFEKAITLDPSYAIAYASLGWVCFHEWSFQGNPDPQMLERMFALAQKAVTLDDSVPQAHELLAWVYLFRDKQHEAALAEINRSLAYGGANWFSSYIVLGHLLNFAGRPEEAIALREQAMRLSPRSADYLLVLGVAYALTGRYEEAITTHQQILTFLPDSLHDHLGLAAIYSQLGREEEARTEAAEVLRLNPQFSLEGLRQRMPYKDPAIAERVLAALRKAGLK